MKTVADSLHIGLVIAGLLAGLLLYKIVARRFTDWLIERPWFGLPSWGRGETASLLNGDGDHGCRRAQRSAH